MDMIVQGFIAALTFVWLLSYLPIRRVFGYALFFDITITAILMFMFAGSYAGMMTAVIAGMMLSAFLRLGGWVFGVERLTLRRRKREVIPSFVWRRTR